MIKKIIKKSFSLLILGLLSISGIQSALALSIPSFPTITFPPFLGVVTPVPAYTTETAPEFTFSSTEGGTISYDGDCVSLTNFAKNGDNTVKFMPMSLGLHNNCRVKVTGETSALDSAWLKVPDFTIVAVLPPAVINLAPFLAIVKPVDNPTYDTTPDFTFTTTEAGTITYSGDCAATTTAAVVGNNTVTFKDLAVGTHSNCKISVTDSMGLGSDLLAIPSFEIKAIPVMPPAGQCSGFKDITDTDADCAAVTWVKSIGAMTGNPDGTFDPNGILQRDQISKIALQTFGKFSLTADYCGGKNPFPDVTSSAWSYQYVCRAKGLGVVTGYLSGPDAGYFRPARSVNRVEFLAIVLRNLTEAMPTGSSYNDVDAGAWYAGYAKFSQINNLFSGSNLYPTNLTSRREVAEVLYKLHTLGKI
jgi:hypothetical protein